MTFFEARNILGPIRVYFDRRLDRWCLDGAEATQKEIIHEAHGMWRRMPYWRQEMILATPITV